MAVVGCHARIPRRGGSGRRFARRPLAAACLLRRHAVREATAILRSWLLPIALGLVPTVAAAGNLLADPLFANVEELGLSGVPSGWNWQRIVAPAHVVAHPTRPAVTLSGGTVFLDSSPVAVAPSTVFDIRLQVHGDGTFASELLWWTADGLPAQTHRMRLTHPTSLKQTALQISGQLRSPHTASVVQLRLIAQGGTAVVQAPFWGVATGALLLSLDATQPGPEPATHWRDLTGTNRNFVLTKGVRHAPQSQSYVFETPGAQCRGAVEDAPRFDFETDLAASAGRGAAFTIVLYAKLGGGRSGNGILNKIGDLQQGGWSVGLEIDEFGIDRVTTLQQSNQERRTINGFPGLAGHNETRLQANDGRFHLYVIHFTGSGGRDGGVYLDGKTTSLQLTPWSFGVLSSGSVRNKAPLRIGAYSQNGFRGEVGFVEIWSGTRLLAGRTPAEYSHFRYRGGHPRRDD